MIASLKMTARNKNWQTAIIWMAVFAVLIRLVVSAEYVHTMDTRWFRTWVMGSQEGLFDMYARAESISLDYPPLYLYPLWLLGQIYRLFPVILDYTPYDLLALKFFGILADVGCAMFIYLIFRNRHFPIAVIGFCAWLFNPALFFNSAMWGQIDSLMCLLLLASFYMLDRGRPYWGVILFAVGGLTKFQCLYLAPLVLIILFRKFGLARFLRAMGAAALTVFAAFLPFMIGSRSPLLVFEVYLNGGGSYPYYTLHAANLYGLLGLNWTTNLRDTAPLLGPITGFHISMALTVLIMAGVVLLYVYGKRKNTWMYGLLLMNSLFMLTTRMHERYQVVVLPFALMLWLTTRERAFLHQFGALTITAFLTQFMALMYNVHRDAPWLPVYETLFCILSAFSLLIFVVSTVYCVRWCLGRGGSAVLPDSQLAEENQLAEE